jgi:hypothetical protein
MVNVGVNYCMLSAKSAGTDEIYLFACTYVFIIIFINIPTTHALTWNVAETSQIFLQDIHILPK